jgi:hypothetical protein
MSQYSTDELVKWANNLCTWDMVSDTLIRDAIIARLRAADKLCEAAKLARESQKWDGNDPDEIRWTELYAKLRKAIAGYEETEEA